MPDKTKWVNEWKQKAENDLRTAEIVLSSEEPPTDTICFHAQQCADKYLKSYLTLKDITIEKTHDLTRINNICIGLDRDFQELSDFAELLSGYAVEIRYPGDFIECSIGEAKEAVEMAKVFKNFVLRKLND
ncbi:MAG: HEPN domain-containing protein [Candidatus Methanoperedens sp.]|nr:HEPN domain-containing protein [Candidatus Methanoperedens sp.]